MSSLFNDYQPGSFFDEMFSATAAARGHYSGIMGSIGTLTPAEYATRQRTADAAFLRQGVTFTVYGDDSQGTERIFPFDLIPRIIPAPVEWEHLGAGLIQRITALNLFLERHLPRQQISATASSPPTRPRRQHFRPRVHELLRAARHLHPHLRHRLIRDERDGNYLVLEDNGRCPSGASYMLENRARSSARFPRLVASCGVRPGRATPTNCSRPSSTLAPAAWKIQTVVLLTPGSYNSAYFEHSFLASRWASRSSRAATSWSSTTPSHAHHQGLQRVDVIYRRIDDDLPRPAGLPRRLLLGVPGLIDAYRAATSPW
jgi:uncharacterized circularly permuted ATP-grasp superfamily protein